MSQIKRLPSSCVYVCVCVCVCVCVFMNEREKQRDTMCVYIRVGKKAGRLQSEGRLGKKEFQE